MAKRWAADEVGVCVFCALACLSAAAIYLFDFGNSPLSRESLFWEAPLLCPVAFLVYLGSKRAGAVVMAMLYVSAVMGAYSLLRPDCDRPGQCLTQSRAAVVMASLVAGFHIIFMLGAVVLMFVGVWRVRRIG